MYRHREVQNNDRRETITSEKHGQKLALIKYLKNVDFKFIRNLPISQIEKIVRRKSELCNWCGIEKKVYFCCDQTCLKHDFICAECSIEWIEHPHYLHEFVYCVPFFSYKMLNNHEILTKNYNNLKSIEIKANFQMIQKLSKFYTRIQKQIAQLDSQKSQIKQKILQIQKIVNNHETKINQLSPIFSELVRLIKHNTIKENIKKLNRFEFQLKVLTTSSYTQAQNRQSNLYNNLIDNQSNNSFLSATLVLPEIQQLLTSKSIINFNQTDPYFYQLISRFYSDNLKGLSLQLLNPVDNTADDSSLKDAYYFKSINNLHMLNNVVEVRVTGQINLMGVLIILNNSGLKSLKVDYITISNIKSKEQVMDIPYYKEQEILQIDQDVVPIGIVKKYSSQIVNLVINYPSIPPILSLMHICSFPQLCRLEFQEIYQPQNSLKDFLRDISIRLPRLQYLSLATYLQKPLVLKIVQDTLESIANRKSSFVSSMNLSEAKQYQLTVSPESSSSYMNINKKKRYEIRCIDHLNVMLREIRLNFEEQFDENINQRAQQLADLQLQGEDYKVRSLGLIDKTRCLFNLVQYYKKKTQYVSKKIIDDLLLFDIL